MKNTLKPITDFFDKEDKEIYESIQRGEWRPIDKKKAEKLKKEMVLAAKEAMDVKRKQQISINLQKDDIAFVKQRALETGIPYQTIISCLLRQYREGNIRLSL